MKRIFLAAAALLTGFAAFAHAPAIRSVNINAVLHDDGTAVFREVWDVTVASGTEWYLVRNNLGDIVISGLAVSDETGTGYVCESGDWNVSRTLEQKAGRCGLHRTGDGYEICWGVGSYGNHVFTVSYTMSNCVKSLEDYDMLYMQLLSPDLSSIPQRVNVTVTAEDGSLITDKNTRFWGFGYEGSSSLENGAVHFDSSGRVESVIALMRFDKGMFHPTSVQDRKFKEAYDIAMNGADFGGDEDNSGFILFLLAFIAAIWALIYAAGYKKRILGMKLKDVPWSREVPCDGNLEASNYVLARLGEQKKSNSYASALILRMIYDGCITVNKKSEKKVELMFNDDKTDSLGSEARSLYDMMKLAAGDDNILQDKEFSRWSKKNYMKVNSWIEKASSAGKSFLVGHNYMNGSKFTPDGQAKARGLVGFRKFLSDFTLMGERDSREVGLWQDYLVFASLFGIADKVAAELKDIDPQFFEQANSCDYNTMSNILLQNSMLSSAITNAQVKATSGAGGRGGTSSFSGGGFGGGGGFSGGGFGGGSR